MIPALVLSAIVLASGPDRGEELIDAARRGDLDTVQQLLADGVDVNSRTRFNITAMWHAASKGHSEIVATLLEAGGDPNVADAVWHMSPLSGASTPEIVTMLVKHKARGVDARLRGAALAGDETTIKAIVESGEVSDQLLAEARAQARLANRGDIVPLLDEAATDTLPDPPEVNPDILQRYAGRYVDQRLNENTIEIRDGQLVIRSEGGGVRRTVARNETTFDFGSTTIRFETEDGNIVRYMQGDEFHMSPYRRLTDSDRPVPRTLTTRSTPAELPSASHWPSFRGMGARGLAAAGQDLPDEWDGATGKNIRWKTPIPGVSNASPVVWGDRIYVTTAISRAGNTDLRIGLYGAGEAVDDQSEHAWRVYCLDGNTGDILWERTADEGVPPIKRHLKSTQSNSTPATDGRHVVALFSSGGLFCYDADGKMMWKKHLGLLDSGAFNDRDYQWGFGSSPIIEDNRVIVQCDLQEGSFLAAYALADGNELWRIQRDEVPSWGTPTVVDGPAGRMIVTNATNAVRGYDVSTGEERFRLTGNAAITVPTPFTADGLIYVTSGYRPIQPIFAIRASATGDISLEDEAESNDHIVWSKPRGGPYLPTPIVYGNWFYACGNNGVLTCYDAKTGQDVFRERVARGAAASFTASPVAADGKIYFTAENGTIFVVRAAAEFEVVAQNDLGEYCLTTPAISGGKLIVRTHKHLIAIGR